MTEKGLVEERRVAIGGEFEMTAVTAKSFHGILGKRICSGGSWTISGRAAFAIILRKLMEQGVSHVHLPSYLCESLLLPVKALGLTFSFYRVDLSLAAHPEPPSGAAVLLIHYFGWLNASTQRLRSEAGGSFYLIEDFSQSFLSGTGAYNTEKSYAFFSARKFGPVPLGGWSSEAAKLNDGKVEVAMVLKRSLSARKLKGCYLSDRNDGIDNSIEASYLGDLESVERFLEADLESELPCAVLDIIGGLDWEEVSRRRRSNWLYMKQSLLGHATLLEHDLPVDTVPLGCVILSEDRCNVRMRLSASRIFCPVHWPMPDDISKADFPEAVHLSQRCLTIPIDQRYAEKDLDRITEILKDS